MNDFGPKNSFLKYQNKRVQISERKMALRKSQIVEFQNY